MMWCYTNHLLEDRNKGFNARKITIECYFLKRFGRLHEQIFGVIDPLFKSLVVVVFHGFIKKHSPFLNRSLKIGA